MSSPDFEILPCKTQPFLLQHQRPKRSLTDIPCRSSAQPPIPRPPTHSAPTTLPDPRNTISRPEGPQHQLLLSEGVYTLRDEILLGPIPPHPSETGPLNPNVLDTKPVVPSAGTRLSIAILAPRRPNSQLRRPPTSPSSGSKSSLPCSSGDNSQEPTRTSSDQGSSRFSGFGIPGFRSKQSEADGSLTLPNGKDAKDVPKRKKPKNNVTKSSSSFISRAIPSETLTKRLSEHASDGHFAIVNINRALMWLDLSSPAKHDPLIKILFTKARALCHDFNETSKTINHMDIIMGFSTSEVFWYEPISQRYTRLNKNGIINSSPITEIKWLPGSENLFIAAHSDGSLVVYDKEKEDAALTFDDETQSATRIHKNGKRVPRLIIRKSMRSKTEKNNPVACWKVSKQRINGLEFSPYGTLLAVTSEDGSLRVIDYEKEIYYGGLTCVAWSPDGAYLLAGGQDDLISIWSVADRALVARCVGHRSWVSKIAFDPWRCDEITYRFGSVGEDGRLLLWDFSHSTLNRPRAASIRQSISSYVTPDSAIRSDSVTTITPSTIEQPSSPPQSADDSDSIAHPFVPRNQVATLPPVLSKEVDPHALAWIHFEEDCIIVSCRVGHIRTWDRPEEEIIENKGSATVDFASPAHQQ